MKKSPASLIKLCALTLLISSTSVYADTLSRWENSYNNYRNASPSLQDRDYTVKSEAVDANGQPITIETKVENDRKERTIDTKVTGPDGLISGKKVETEYNRDEIKTKTTTTDADGKIDIQHQTLEFDD